jgi:hypothetical protein
MANKAKGVGPYHANKDKEPGRYVSDDGDGQGRGSCDSGKVTSRSIAADVDANSYVGSGALKPSERK